MEITDFSNIKCNNTLLICILDILINKYFFFKIYGKKISYAII